ncbi:MAG TPA: succinate dehydrogenase, hydrophobic membrane anchor protein [Sphingomonas sp.]
MGNGTELGRVRGLGAAGQGTDHWWHQRLTAGGNLLLVLWFIVSIARLPAYDHATLTAWIASFWVAIPLALLVLSVFWHFRLGLQVAIEDYSHGPGRIAWLVLLNAFTLVAGAIALFSILSIAFTSGAAA